MEPLTTIGRLLAEGKITVPEYQRAYSWDTDTGDAHNQHTSVFVTDLEDCLELKSGAYYFGHFLFEKTDKDNELAVIDGQQRLTTIEIFLAALFRRLREIREGGLTEDEQQDYEDLVKRGSKYRFETVPYDRMFFNDYVVDRVRTNSTGLDTVSARRIADAYDYFAALLANKDEQYIVNMIGVLKSAKCTTHVVDGTGDAIQMFLMQNNRGKKPTRLEIVKALLMRATHLYGGDQTGSLTRDIVERFSEIYKSISRIECYVNEDNILSCAMKVYARKLWKEGSIQEIEQEIKDRKLEFVGEFCRILETCFRHLDEFYSHAAEQNEIAHGIRVMGLNSWAMPFVVQGYNFGLNAQEQLIVWRCVETLSLRHWAIGTRAALVSRLSDVFETMNRDTMVERLRERVLKLCKAQDWWWSYWNDGQLKNVLTREITDRRLSKYLLWRYENTLVANGEQQGYGWKRYDEIVLPELEHIAPQTPTDGKPVAHGYGPYDDPDQPERGIVSGHWLDSIGNQLILPKSHNCQIGNHDFKGKYDSYAGHTQSQHEVRVIADKYREAGKDLTWSQACIKARRDKIVNELMKSLALHESVWQGTGM